MATIATSGFFSLLPTTLNCALDNADNIRPNASTRECAVPSSSRSLSPRTSQNARARDDPSATSVAQAIAIDSFPDGVPRAPDALAAEGARRGAAAAAGSWLSTSSGESARPPRIRNTDHPGRERGRMGGHIDHERTSENLAQCLLPHIFPTGHRATYLEYDRRESQDFEVAQSALRAASTRAGRLLRGYCVAIAWRRRRRRHAGLRFRLSTQCKKNNGNVDRGGGDGMFYTPPSRHHHWGPIRAPAAPTAIAAVPWLQRHYQSILATVNSAYIAGYRELTAFCDDEAWGRGGGKERKLSFRHAKRACPAQTGMIGLIGHAFW
ncbi:hypothetical protein GGX14DRAFT_395778 [Mycena pura]|uniref:Uncharacterized protein n=1 Tax=Mycena pura TaxID=153505 RepID=A0AAD6VC53_9AGAR|nr:hypothetical protein GGX14DRAFT_395778 [Mycena pura]